MKLCNDCRHKKNNDCAFVYKNPVDGRDDPQRSCLYARSSEYACGYEAKCFEPKEVKTYTFIEAMQKAIDNPGMKFCHAHASFRYGENIFYYDLENGIMSNFSGSMFEISDGDIKVMWEEYKG